MKAIRVIYHREPEGWWADSPDVPGWSAAGESYDKVRALVDEGVALALGRDDVTIEHVVPADGAVSA